LIVGIALVSTARVFFWGLIVAGFVCAAAGCKEKETGVIPEMTAHAKVIRLKPIAYFSSSPLGTIPLNKFGSGLCI
jgi:hypothetical protein